jgi:hypothetical protein
MLGCAYSTENIERNTIVQCTSCTYVYDYYGSCVLITFSCTRAVSLPARGGEGVDRLAGVLLHVVAQHVLQPALHGVGFRDPAGTQLTGLWYTRGNYCVNPIGNGINLCQSMRAKSSCTNQWENWEQNQLVLTNRSRGSEN